jgi:hypothetical protein
VSQERKKEREKERKKGEKKREKYFGRHHDEGLAGDFDPVRFFKREGLGSNQDDLLSLVELALQCPVNSVRDKTKCKE